MIRPPPNAYEFLRSKPSGDPRWWRILCPACCAATVAVIHDRRTWRLAAEIGCSQGCQEPEILWWQAWRLGQLPPRPAPDEPARRYSSTVVERILGGLPERSELGHLRRAAFECGRWIEAGDVDARPVARHLLLAARRAGCSDEPDIAMLAAALTAGRAKPPRVPS